MKVIDGLELIMFDLDGTLIDSNGSNNDLDCKLVEFLTNEEVDCEEVIKRRDEVLKNSNSNDIYLDYCEFLRKQFNSSFSKEQILNHRREMSREMSKTINLKSGADKILKYLKKTNKLLALATVSRRETLDIYEKENENINKYFKFSECFDYILTKEDVINKKPNPEVYNKIVSRFNLDKKKCLIIEDSLSGVQAAKNAGITVAVVYDKYNDKDRQEINKLADYKFENFEQLIDFLETENQSSPCVFRKRNTDKFLAFIEITNACNMKCKHCMNWSVKNAKLGFNKEQIIKLVDDLYQNNTEEIYISGGEPLIYPYIDEVLKHAHELGIKVTLATNALEVLNHLDIIKECVQLVSISFDGIGKTHDKFRGVEGAYDNCLKVFKVLKDNNVKTRISAMIWKDNVDQIEEMVSIAKQHGVSKVNLAFLIPEGRAKNNESINIPIESYNELIDKVSEIKNKYKTEDFDIELRRITKLNNFSLDCPGGDNLLHINVDGKVSPCSWISKLDTENEFSSMWPDLGIKECIDKFSDFKNVVSKRKIKYGYCGCVALSKIYNGDFCAEDPLNIFLKK